MKSIPYQTLIRHRLSENLKKELHITRRWFKDNSLKWSGNPKNKSVSSLVLFRWDTASKAILFFLHLPQISVVREALSEDLPEMPKYL